jgi:hypothetical protein
MNGNHRPVGVLLLSKPVRVEPDPGGARPPMARIEDVAPTVLAELGVAAPPMDGRPLWGAIPDNPKGDAPYAPRESVEYTPEQERVIEERLRALGYLE